MKNILLLIAIILINCELTAQQRHVLQVSGVVVATDSLVSMPFVTIYRSSDHRGTYSDYSGYFTLPMQAGDTLNFTCIGLKNSSFVISSDTTQNHVSIVQLMETDTFTMQTITILPYPAPHKLRQELLALDLPGDGYKQFDRQPSNVAAYDGLYDLAEQSTSNEQALLNSRVTSGLVVGGNLLDGAAWKRFVRSLKDDK